MSTTDQDCENQMQAMYENANKWRSENPTKEAMIQFNIPPKIFLCAPISNAIRDGFVSTNEAGLELIKALWPWDNQREPTVAMVRAVLEHKQP